MKARPPRLGVLGLALAVLLEAACQAAPPADLDRVLKGTWQSYRQSFISPAGRVVIPEQDGSTISEAQAYALLRAVWAGDEATFVLVRAWTRQHLSRAHGTRDHLLSWSWGRQPDGSLGLKDANTAADADVDYALALILAARRGWRAPPGTPAYREEARQLLKDILAQEVVSLPDGELLLTPGNWHEAGPPYLANPSYFSPAAYHLFAQVQPDPRWGSLKQSTYRLLKEKFLPFFHKEWQAQGRLAAVYNYDGTPAVAYESPVLYAGVLAAALAAGERNFAGQLAQRILTFYHERDGQAYFVAPDNYYANNWAWLGLALYGGWVKDFQAK